MQFATRECAAAAQMHMQMMHTTECRFATEEDVMEHDGTPGAVRLTTNVVAAYREAAPYLPYRRVHFLGEMRLHVLSSRACASFRVGGDTGDFFARCCMQAMALSLSLSLSLSLFLCRSLALCRWTPEGIRV
jgi:hypothetical protein